MTDDYLWKIRCPESGYLVGECCCNYCFDEFEVYSELTEWDEDYEDEDKEYDLDLDEEYDEFDDYDEEEELYEQY